MFKARLYLDVDGVLNATHPQHDDVKTFQFPTNKGNGLVVTDTVVYSPFVVSELDRFREEYNVELVWLTTWSENLEVLKLGNHLDALKGGRVLHGVIDRTVTTDRAWTAWKAKALLDDQKDDETPFVWVDDEAIKFHGETVNLETDSTAKLFVEPRPYWGLTKTNLKAMEAFLTGL